MMNEPIGTINGSWWLLQMWLNLHLQRVAINDLKTLSFPSLNHSKAQEKKLNQEDKFRRCQSFGEAALAILINWSAGQFFKGISDKVLTWFVCPEVAEFELPISLRFETACSDELSTAIFQYIVKPGLLPVEFRHGHEKPPTSYEFYNPSVATHRLGCDNCHRGHSLQTS
jgi:hypothetical protein